MWYHLSVISVFVIFSSRTDICIFVHTYVCIFDAARWRVICRAYHLLSYTLLNIQISQYLRAQRGHKNYSHRYKNYSQSVSSAIIISWYLSRDVYICLHLHSRIRNSCKAKGKPNPEIVRSAVYSSPFFFFFAATIYLIYSTSARLYTWSGLVFFTSFPVYHTLPRLVYFYFVARLSLTLNSRRTGEHSCPLLSRPAANLMTPRIIVRLLTGEKWPFTCGRI